jgi:hypothetical protein
VLWQLLQPDGTTGHMQAAAALQAVVETEGASMTVQVATTPHVPFEQRLPQCSQQHGALKPEPVPIYKAAVVPQQHGALQPPAWQALGWTAYLHNHCVNLLRAELELVAGQAVAQTQRHRGQVSATQLTAQTESAPSTDDTPAPMLTSSCSN